MDPNACLERLVRAVLSGEWEEATEAAEDLTYWVARGGFRPVKAPSGYRLACDVVAGVVGDDHRRPKLRDADSRARLIQVALGFLQEGEA